MSQQRPERPPMLRFSRDEFSGDDDSYDAHIQKCDDYERTRMSEQHRVITKLIPTTHNDNILLECDQLLLDDWDRRLNESPVVESKRQAPPPSEKPKVTDKIRF
jgi:hypothetical protein